jgi:hypothetical protein
VLVDRILFGDNQFFGINHMSEDVARQQELRFQDTKAITNVLDLALAQGVRTFMCTTHERVEQVCAHVRSQPQRYSDYVFYPCMPYAHKYANAVTEHGILGAVRKYLPENALRTALVGGLSLARKDVAGIIRLLIDSEMAMFRGLTTPVIFLQNVVTDLLLGLGFNEAFAIFASHIAEKYNAEPGFITMNLPRLVPVLEQVGIKNPIVCANINKIGFRMCGGLERYEQVLRDHEVRAIAMSVFASGAINAEEAIDYVCRQPRVESIVFGASSASHIAQTCNAIKRHWPS